jgi:LysM domain
MSAVSTLEDVSIEGSGAGDGWSRPRQRHLFVVTGRPVPDRQAVAAGSGRRPAPPPGSAVTTGSARASSASAAPARAAGSAPRSAAPARPAAVTSPAPIRLTRRGRVVVGALAVIVATVGVTVASMAAAGGAQAANHGRPAAGYAGLRQIVVRPGQTLWSIAAQVEPSADPRLVVAEIMTANAMTSAVIEAGQLLWVPR